MKFKHHLQFRETSDGLVYKSIETELEISQCYQLYQKSFLKDEPITRNFRDKKVQTQKELKFFDDCLFYGPVGDGVSLIAVDPEAGNRVVGMRISSVVDRGESDECPDLSSYSLYTQLVFHCFDLVGSPEEMLDTHPTLNRIYYMTMMGVEEEYRGRGIAGNLLTKSLDLARLARCDGAYVTATSGITRRIFAKRGMEEVRSLEWDKIEFRGELLCVGKDFGSDKISSHFLKL
eukprot:GFUD01012284.1.p1 GENE.GFUD01012284.1~~GFUD01012284.1.p1  ORF type:complete len:233 (+),score=62.65 GFUD01012284.1:214-912(+)